MGEIVCHPCVHTCIPDFVGFSTVEHCTSGASVMLGAVLKADKE